MRAKVFNRHDRTHKEEFKGTMISIAPGECVEMEYEEAVEFKSQYFPMKLLADDSPDPNFFKKIEIVPLGNPAAAAKLVCPITKKEFLTQKEFDAHLEQFRDRVVKDDALDEEIAQKRGPGRPAKGAA